MSNVKCQLSKVKSKPSGYIALISVLIISTIGLVLGVSFAQEAMETDKTITHSYKGSQALMNATNCAERALMELRDDSAYDGDQAFTLDKGDCYIRPLSSQDSQKIIEVKGTVDNFVSKIRIKVATTTPKIEIISWQEVKDF